MPIVIDASALVEVLVQSKRAPAVIQAVGSTEMVAPDVINPEVLSTLRRMERIGKLGAGRASQAVDDLLDAGVRCFPTLPLLLGGVDVAGQRLRHRRLLRRLGPGPPVPAGHQGPAAVPGAGAGRADDHRLAAIRRQRVRTTLPVTLRA